MKARLSPDASTVALYQLSEGSGTQAKDTNKLFNNGSVNGATWTSGELVFDGNDYVEVPASSVTNLSSYTLECKVYITSLPSVWYGLIVKNPSNNNNCNYNLWIGSDGKLGLSYGNGATTNGVKYSTGTVPTNQWVHVAVTVGGGNTNFYINGIASGSYAGQITPINTYNMLTSIGARKWTDGTPGIDEYLNGKIKEVRIWNIVRTSTEIADNINSSFTGNETGLAVYLPMNEGNGVSVKDLAGYTTNKHGTITNPVWADTELGKALLANDAGSTYIDCGNLSLAGQTFVTIEATLKYPTDPTVLKVMFGWTVSGFATSYNLIQYYTGGIPRFGFNTANGDCYGVDPTPWLGKEIDIAAVFKKDAPTQCKLYINGVLQTLSAIGGGPNLTRAKFDTNFFIGGIPVVGPYGFNGYITNVRVSVGERSAAEIKYNISKIRQIIM